MAPPVEAFTPAQLAHRVQYKPDGKLRKPPFALADCQLMEMVQYACNLDGPRNDPRSRVVCEPVLRLFRKCANNLMVETTSWEGVYSR